LREIPWSIYEHIERDDLIEKGDSIERDDIIEKGDSIERDDIINL